MAEHALAAHAGGAQHQRPLLHGSTHGSSATAHGHSNGLHVLSPMHDTLDSSMFLHGMQLTGPGCNGIDPVCQLDLRCDPVDTLQQLRSCLSAHGSAMLLVQVGRWHGWQGTSQCVGEAILLSSKHYSRIRQFVGHDSRAGR